MTARQDDRHRPYRLGHAKDPFGQPGMAASGDHFSGKPRQEENKHRGGAEAVRWAAEVLKQDIHMDEGGGITFRTKLQLSFKYEHEH